jgi:FkbM family methyltransferase
VYDVVNRTGLLQTGFCRRAFQDAYFLYKSWWEDPFRDLVSTRKHLFTGGHIIDVGANIGYTASVFAQVVSEECKIFAFEPEASNFSLLLDVVNRRHLRDRIIPCQAAAGEMNGTIKLWRNKSSHADHRVATAEFQAFLQEHEEFDQVPIVSIDSFLEGQRIEDPICFVKIDVQGYETSVCNGMRETIAKNPNICIAFEYAPEQMHELGFDGPELIRFFLERNFFLYILKRGGMLEPIADVDRLGSMKEPYFDVLASQERL